MAAFRWTPPTKRRLARIVDLDPGLHGLLTAIYADGAAFKDQLVLARRTVPLIYDEGAHLTLVHPYGGDRRALQQRLGFAFSGSLVEPFTTCP